MGHGHVSDKGHWHFLNSTCDMGTSPSRAPPLMRLRKVSASLWLRMIILSLSPGAKPPVLLGVNKVLGGSLLLMPTKCGEPS